MKTQKGLDTGRFVIITIFFGVLVTISLATSGCNDQMARMEESQTRLQAMVAANSRQLATVSSQVHAGQNEQSRLHATVASNNQQFAKQLTQLERSQTLLRDGVTQVADMAQTTNTSVSTIAREHATLHQMVQNSRQELADEITAVAHTQKATQELIQGNNEQMIGHLTTVEANVAAVAKEQASVQGAVRTQATALADKIAVVQQHQQDMQLVIDQVANTAGRTADGVSGLTSTQAAMQQQQETNHKALTGQFAAISRNQQNLQAGIGTLDAKADQTAVELATLKQTTARNDETLTTLSENQAELRHGISGLDSKANALVGSVTSVSAELTALHQTAKTHNQSLDAHATTLAENQRALKAGLGELTEQTGLVAAAQASLQQAVQNHSETARGQLSNLTANQETLQGNLSTLTQTASQVALDILAMDTRQSAFQQAVRSGITGLDERTAQIVAAQTSLDEALTTHGETISGQVTKLTQTQQQMQSGLDIVTATTGQVALDVIAMDENQAKLGRAVQADREALVTKLAEIAQGQQQWLARFDDAQAKVETMTASIAALQQRATELQGTLQDSLQGVTTQLDNGTQQRARFEETVNQNMQALAEWVSQLRETQGSLQQQMQQVQDSTQNQNTDILSALQQLQQKTDANLLEAGAELKSSKATAPHEVALP